MLSKIQQTPEALAEIEQFDDLREKLTWYTGKNITNLTDLFLLYQTLNTEHWLNLILPEWTQDIFPHGRLFDALILYYKLQSYNDELTRLNGGKLKSKAYLSIIKVDNLSTYLITKDQ